MEHVIALKSLALRSPKTVAYWSRLARQTSNVWERHQIVINAWGRFGRKFAPAALDLLKTEPSQYIQWELLNGNLQTRQDYVYRDYWDIWIPANILVPMEFPEGGRRPPQPKMDESDLNALLQWLESGARPKDPWVYNHMLYHLADFVSGNDTRRLLRFFNAHPERAKNYGSSSISAIRPRYRCLNIGPRCPRRPINSKISRALSPGSIIAVTRARQPPPHAAKPPKSVCSTISRTPSPASPVEIHSEKDAQAWLHSTSPSSLRLQNRLHRRHQALRHSHLQSRLRPTLGIHLRLLAPHRPSLHHSPLTTPHSSGFSLCSAGRPALAAFGLALPSRLRGTRMLQYSFPCSLP